jgi:hypothetical protein
LYFDHLDEDKRFCGETLGFDIRDEVPGHFTRLVTEPAFICLERKGMQPHPSRDKAWIFLEVPNLVEAVNAVGRQQIVEMKPQGEPARQPGAVLHDPGGYNIVLVEAASCGCDELAHWCSGPQPQRLIFGQTFSRSPNFGCRHKYTSKCS